MPKYTGVNHLAFATADLKTTILFWRDLLGLRLVLTSGKAGYKLYFFELSRDCLVGFFEWPGLEPIEEKEHGMPTKGPFAFDHVSLGLESEDELYSLKDKLNAAGIWVSEVIDHGFIHSIYTFDPNGIALEFSVTVRDITRNPVFADCEPSNLATEGSEPVPGRWPEVKNPTLPEERRAYPGMGAEIF